MKPFTIRKAVQPNSRQGEHGIGEMGSSKYATGGDRGSSMLGEEGAGQQADLPYGQMTNLTDEELEQLKPKEVRVVNPWIHDQTH